MPMYVSRCDRCSALIRLALPAPQTELPTLARLAVRAQARR